MFSSLMPQRKEFFVQLEQLAQEVLAGANANLRLINSLDTDKAAIPALTQEIELHDDKASQIKASLITLLHQSFTTPINRDQIHTLTLDMDNIFDAILDVTYAIGMYNITQSTAESRELAVYASDACRLLHTAIAGLSDRKRNQELVNICKEIDQIELNADKTQRKAITVLFQEEASIWNALKMRKFYSLQEDILDLCEDAAKTIEEILIENA